MAGFYETRGIKEICGLALPPECGAYWARDVFGFGSDGVVVEWKGRDRVVLITPAMLPAGRDRCLRDLCDLAVISEKFEHFRL